MGQTGNMSANGPRERGSIPGQDISMTYKLVLESALHNIQHYKVQIKSKV